MRRGCTLKVIALLALVVVQLACRLTPSQPVRDRIELYPSKTLEPTQTPLVVVHTSTPLPTYTPVVVVHTQTPVELGVLCVVAQEAVYLRATPNGQFYPIDPLTNGTRVFPTGAKDAAWLFVNVGERSGWIHGNYLGACV